MAESNENTGDAGGAYIEPIGSDEEAYQEISLAYVAPVDTATPRGVPQQTNQPQDYIQPIPATGQHRGSLPVASNYSTQINQGARPASAANVGINQDVDHIYLQTVPPVAYEPPPSYARSAAVHYDGYQQPGQQLQQPHPGQGPIGQPQMAGRIDNPHFVGNPPGPYATQPGARPNIYHPNPGVNPGFQAPVYLPAEPTKFQTTMPTGPPQKSAITTILAVGSLVISVLALCCWVNICCTIPAMILASQSLSGATDPQKAKAYAIASMVLSGISVATFVITLIVFINAINSTYSNDYYY